MTHEAKEMAQSLCDEYGLDDHSQAYIQEACSSLLLGSTVEAVDRALTKTTATLLHATGSREKTLQIYLDLLGRIIDVELQRDRFFYAARLRGLKQNLASFLPLT